MAQYLDNKKLHETMVIHLKEVKKAKKEHKTPPPIPPYVCECIMLIAKNMTRHPHFNRYTQHWHDEMVGDSIENCFRYYKSYNPKKTNNPFGYYSRIVYRAFQRRIRAEKQELYVRYKSTVQAGILDEAHQDEIKEITNDDTMTNQFEIYGNIVEFIDKFEKADAERKKRKKEKKAEKEKALTQPKKS